MHRPGDVVTLSIRPPVALTQFQYLKSGVSITRTLGEDPPADLREMRAALPRLYAEAVGQELKILDALTQIIEAEGSTLDDLKSWIVEHAHGSEEETVEAIGGQAGVESGKVASQKKKVRRKSKAVSDPGGGSKKARRRAIRRKG